MVNKGIVLGHKVSSKGIEVDYAKVDVIEKLPTPTSVKEVQRFLEHVGFYKMNSMTSKNSKLISNLLMKYVKFEFDDNYLHVFQLLKEKLITSSVAVGLNWSLPFKLMCDASDTTIGQFWGQRKNKIFDIIYYASKTLKNLWL